MPILVQDIRNDRQFLAATGHNKKEFYHLLESFDSTYKNIFGIRLSNQLQKSNRTKLSDAENCLFFVLYQLKNNLSLDVLGLCFDIARQDADTYFKKYSKILKATLQNEKLYPQREFKSKKEFNDCFKDEDILLIDATEDPRERPKDPDKQKDVYSGKKKTYG